jgi:nucleotide-binding universal stress UspA family protein
LEKIMQTRGCILLAFDGSAHSLKALDEAIRLVKGLQTRLIVLHVYWGEAADVYIDPKRIAIEDVDVEAQKMSRKLEKILKDGGVEYVLKSERSTDVAHSITENAEKENCEMIVIGNRGVGRVRGFLLGSVAEKVVSTSRCSVLIVK